MQCLLLPPREKYHSPLSLYYPTAALRNSESTPPILRAKTREDFIPKEQIKKNSNFILAVTPRGGHIDFFSGHKAVRWVYWPCMEFLDHIDKKEDEKRMEFE